MPTVVISPTQDTFLDESGVSPRGGATTFTVGWASVPGQANGLLDFSMATVTARPTLAVLRLRCTTASAFARDLSFVQTDIATSPWVEANADWDEYDTALTWIAPGGDIDASGGEVSGSDTLPTISAAFYDYDVTDLLQNAFDRALSTCAIFMTTGAGGSDGRAGFASRSHITSTFRPVLTVTLPLAPSGGRMWVGGFQELTGRIDG